MPPSAGPLICRADESIVIAELLATESSMTVSGVTRPEKFISSVLNEFVGDETATEFTLSDCGKFCTVVGEICTALKPALVSKTAWPVPGIFPSDHEGGV